MKPSTLSTQTLMSCTLVTSDGEGASFFSDKKVELNGSDERMLSEQISAVNFRLRDSNSSYRSDWHVAHDPTLLIVLTGCIEIELRDGSTKKFTPGQMFIAQDYLKENVEFDDKKHGHRAQVIGDDRLNALHLKLNKR